MTPVTLVGSILEDKRDELVAQRNEHFNAYVNGDNIQERLMDFLEYTLAKAGLEALNDFAEESFHIIEKVREEQGKGGETTDRSE